MTDEIKALLEKYCSAFANFYGLIPMRKFLEIYNSQNDPITMQELEEFFNSMNFEDKLYDVIGADEVFSNAPETQFADKELAAEYLYCLGDWDEYIKLRLYQAHYDYYVPKKEKLLRYADDMFFEKTMEFIDLRAFLRNQPTLTKERADDIAEDIYSILIINLPDESSAVEEGIGDAGRMGFTPANFYERTQFVKLITELDKSIRKHCYCGHNFREVFQGNF